MLLVNVDDLHRDIRTYMETYAFAYCKKAEQLLTEKARWSARQFYEDYNPAIYDRTYDFRDNSVQPYYHNNGHGTIYGGVKLTSQNMQDYKGNTAFEVSEFAWNGWHGDPTGYNGRFEPIHTKPPIDMIKEYMNSKEFLDTISADAHKKAKSQKYSVLDFID